jgi:uncharacterized coiled-coil protein SlyX
MEALVALLGSVVGSAVGAWFILRLRQQALDREFDKKRRGMDASFKEWEKLFSEAMEREDVMEPYDDLLSDADDVIESLKARIHELEGKLAEQDAAEEAHLQIIFNQNIRITEAEAQLAQLKRQIEQAGGVPTWSVE